MPKYLDGIEAFQRGLDMHWFNWHVNRGHTAYPVNFDGYPRQYMRRVSWRRKL